MCYKTCYLTPMESYFKLLKIKEWIAARVGTPLV